MASLPTPLVDPGWLRSNLELSELRLLDARWSLPAGAELEAYRGGHIPRALFVDLDRDLASPPGPGGRHPLPDPAAFQEAMRQRGIGRNSPVVIYDRVTGAAARAWWLLRAAGHQQVAVLDGGIDAFLADGGALTSVVDQPPPGDIEVQDFSGVVAADQIAGRRAGGQLLLDARARERYRGEPSPLDPRPGHIPGARNLPWMEVYSKGRVKDPTEVRRLLLAIGDPEEQVVAYCGSGVTACALLLALESAGIAGGLLYPGSWSEWAGDESRAAELGS